MQMIACLLTTILRRCPAWPLLLGALPVVAQGDSPSAGFDFSGIQRARYEALSGQFLAGLDESDDVLALQTSLRFVVGGSRLQFVGEILDSRAELNDTGSLVNNTIVNSLEPLQAHVAWRLTSSDKSDAGNVVRVGRMTLDLGKRRLLSRNRFRNTVNNFIGADWEWHTGDRKLTAFYLIPMRQLPTDTASLLDNEFELDRAMRDTALRGIFYEFPEIREDHVVEIYAIDYQTDASDPLGQADLLSLGARAYRTPAKSRWHYEIEAIAQRGDSGVTVSGVPTAHQDHTATFMHVGLGFEFDARWAPVLTFEYDRASGDQNPFDAGNDRFNTLFGDRRFEFGPTGIYGPFQRSNLETPGVRVAFTLSPRWQGMVSYRDFELESHTDAWVGTGLRDPSGSAGRSLGSQIEAAVTWDVLPRRLSLDVGFAALNFGRFATQTLGPGPHDDPRYYYAAVSTRF
jgi:hypothetical protein